MKTMSLPNGRTVNFYSVTKIGGGQYVKVSLPGWFKQHFVACFTEEEFTAMYNDAMKVGFKMARDNPNMIDIETSTKTI